MSGVKLLVSLCLWMCLATLPAFAVDDTTLSTLIIQTPNSSLSFFTEVAVSPEAKERGLMFRQVMPEDQAMLFEFSPPQPVQFWMKNTLISLDIIFVRADGTIAAIAENAVPKSLDTIGVQEPVAAVVEIAGGVAKKRGIHKGDHVGGAAFPALN